MPKSKSNELADKLMSELISSRGFQKLWQETALELVGDSQQHQPSHSDKYDNNHINEINSSPNIDSITAGQVVEELSSNIILTVENFLRNLPLGLPHSEDRLNRETANLYSVRVQLDRLSNHSQLQLPQLRLAARRLSYLLKNFSICTSSHFPVPSCSFLASSLCDLLYRYEELCSINEELVPSTASIRLKRAIDDFHYDIVKRLNAILLQRRPQTAATTTTTTSGLGTSCRSFSNLSLSPNILSRTIGGSRVSLAPTIIFQRTPSKPSTKKSFFLSPDLEAARARIRRSRSLLISSSPSNRKTTIDEIERRWRTMLNKDDANAILKSVANREGAESQAALKAACKLTRSVVDEIAKHVERL
uniref:Uncharacterized protein n=1 Tax=Panagrolaimus sp. PS1159 TaxID=55785 RepID=A0AC35FL21_9BILA